MSKPIHSISTGFLDFPGRYSATLFFAGCNLRCSFCYNKDIVDGQGYISLGDASSFVANVADSFEGGMGVVFSGGEPTADEDTLVEAVDLFGDRYPLGLHTNGLIIPEGDVPEKFESVILSVKNPDIIGIPKYNYMRTLVKAIEAYDGAKVRELRFIKDTIPSDMLLDLASAAEGWEFAAVENHKQKGGLSLW